MIHNNNLIQGFKPTNMIRKIGLIGLLSLCAFYASAQKETRQEIDSVASQVLDQRFVGGQKAFYKHIGQTIRYPLEARENCRGGTLFLSVKIRPSGAIDSIQFKNDIELGMGIENEVIRCLLSTKGQWLKANDYAVLNFSIAFWIEEAKAKDRPTATLLVVAYGFSSFCPTYQDIVKAYEKAKKKKSYREAIDLCEDLRRRNPYSEDFKKEYQELKSNLD